MSLYDEECWTLHGERLSIQALALYIKYCPTRITSLVIDLLKECGKMNIVRRFNSIELYCRKLYTLSTLHVHSVHFSLFSQNEEEYTLLIHSTYSTFISHFSLYTQDEEEEYTMHF